MESKFKYDFFISYPHMNEDLNTPHLITAFAKRLEEKLSFYRQHADTKTAWRDEDRLKPGFRWNNDIARALCHSRCLILVYNEEYFSREYCVLEYHAMRQLELKRVGRQINSMIIPVIVQCEGDIGDNPVLPKEVTEFQWIDFRSMLDPARQFRNTKCLEKVQSIVKRTEDLRRLCSTPVIECESFNFIAPVIAPKPEPVEAYAGAWTPSPLAQASGVYP